jgi:hypothetical protein
VHSIISASLVVMAPVGDGSRGELRLVSLQVVRPSSHRCCNATFFLQSRLDFVRNEV